MPHSPNILIIEDDSLTAWHLTMLVKEWGYQVTGWANTQPLSLAYLRHRRPDLVLFNLAPYGRWSNNDLLAAIVFFWKIPVIICAATPPAVEVLEQKSVFYLSKPFWMHQLRETVDIALGEECRSS